MKVYRIGLMTCLLLILVSGGVLAQTSDVPPGHWAYGAVQSLIERGYLDVSDGGMFHGERPVSRYDLAGVVARILDDIEHGRVQIGAAADVDMLRRLESEFRAELVQWYDARRELEEAHGQTQRQIAVIDEQLNRILFELEQHDGDINILYAQLTDLAGRLADATDQFRTDIDGLYHSVIEALDTHGVNVEEQFDQQMSAYGQLERQLGQLRADVDDLAEQFDNRLGEQGAALFLRMGELMDELERTRAAAGANELAWRAAFEEQRSALQSFGARLDNDVAELRAMVSMLDALSAQVDAEQVQLRGALVALQDQVDTLQSVLGTSDEQIARLTERLGRDLDEQLALTLHREGQLVRQLGDLQNEFASYRRRTEQELQNARRMSNIGIGIAVLAVLFSVSK